MINFFRKTRKKLADDNKPLKYMRYAIGEILLVVIGILIALSINNWNENRKDIDLEKEVLNTLVESMEVNCKRLQSRIWSIAKYRKKGGVIISVIENKLSYHDSLENYFHHGLIKTGNIRLSNVGYEAIKDVGLGIVRNKMLKKELMEFFEQTQPRFHVQLKWEDVDRSDIEKFMDEHFIQSAIDRGVRHKPFDVNKLFLDRYFIAVIYKTDLRRVFFSEIMENHLKKSQELLKTVKKELNE